MGNSFSGKKRSIKVMKIDGASFKLKPPAQAATALAGHPGYNLLDAEEVKRIGTRALPLEPDAPLKPGKLYFLVELPRAADPRAPTRRAWSGALHVGAKERLESLKISRRTMSDLSSIATRQRAAVEAEETKDRAVRLKMRLPKAQVERLMQESKNAIEAAERIAELCIMREGGAPEKAPLPPAISVVRGGRKEKRARFAEMPAEVIA